MSRQDFVITIELTLEEAALLAPVLKQILPADERTGIRAIRSRTALLAVRVAARIEAQIGDAIALRERITHERSKKRAREYDCPVHCKPLRLDRNSIGAVLESYYCPTRDCDYVREISR